MEAFIVGIVILGIVLWFLKEDFKSRWRDNSDEDKEQDKRSDHGMDAGDGGGA